MNPTQSEDPLVSYLLDLKRRDDRGALAELRSGLGKAPGEAPRMFPHVGRYLLSSDPSKPSVITAFVVASLFAKHPVHEAGRSLGKALALATKRPGNPQGKHGEDGVAARFARALDADPEDLPRQLEGLISLCESADKGIDWYQFRGDVVALLGEDHDQRDRVRLRWARDFWQSTPSSTQATETQGTQS